MPVVKEAFVATEDKRFFSHNGVDYWSMPHPAMTSDEVRMRTQGVWDRFYALPQIWRRSRCVSSLKARLAFVLVSKLYRQMYANTGLSTDSARRSTSVRWTRWLGRPCHRLFAGRPMPDLQMPS